MKTTASRMLSVAKNLKIRHAGSYEFNHKPVFAFMNGVLELNDTNLATRFHEHSPEYMLTHCVPYSYDPKATCKKFLKFVSEVCANY